MIFIFDEYLGKYKKRTDIIIDEIGIIDDITKSNYILKEVIDGINVTTIKIDEKRSKIINKKIGSYITIEFENRLEDEEYINTISTVVSTYINKLLTDIKIINPDNILIVGLGNRSSTPDSLGPLVCDNIYVTGHYYKMNIDVSNKLKCVYAIVPGVMAKTGIETSEYIKTIVNKIKPSLVIVIDALSSSSIDRLNKTIQISDTGIHPGSGVGNSRKEISYEYLNVPVLSIGVPTVIDAPIIFSDTLNYMKDYFNKRSSEDEDKVNSKVAGLIGELEDDKVIELIKEVLTPNGHNLIVTEKNIDFVIDNLVKILSKSINEAIHRQVIS